MVCLSLVFLPCVTYSEWYIDELFAAVRNADARGETPLKELLVHDFWGNSLWTGGWTHKSYRPLVVLSYVWQYWLNGWEYKPQPLRAFNVALHTMNSVLTFVLLRKYGISRRWACLGAGLFAAHPVHAENAIYLVGRADALATCCWLLALTTWPSSAVPTCRARCSLSFCLRLILAFALAVSAGLCKESGFCVLLQLALIQMLGPRPLQSSLPLLSAFCVVYLCRSWYTDGTSAGFSYMDTPVKYHEDKSVRCWTYLYYHAKYAQLMVFPWTLSWEYSYDALPLLRETWQDVRSLAPVGLYLAVSAVAAYGCHMRSRKLLAGLGNVLIPFVPASNLFFLVGVTVGERLLYPCNVGGAILIATLGQGLHGSASRSRARFLAGLMLLVAFVGLSCLRTYQWSSRELLFEADARIYPRAAKLRHQYGTVLHKQGRFEEALVHYDASLRIFSDNALTEYCIAQILIESGRAAEAKPRFQHIFAGHGNGFGGFNLYAPYIDYGFTLMLLKEFEASLPPLMQGLGRNEDVPHGLNGLGYSLMQLQRPSEALSAFQRGVKYDPLNPYLLNNLGVALMMTNRVQEGTVLLQATAQAAPQVPAFAHNGRLVAQMLATSRPPSDAFMMELFFNRGP